MKNTCWIRARCNCENHASGVPVSWGRSVVVTWVRRYNTRRSPACRVIRCEWGSRTTRRRAHRLNCTTVSQSVELVAIWRQQRSSRHSFPFYNSRFFLVLSSIININFSQNDRFWWLSRVEKNRAREFFHNRECLNSKPRSWRRLGRQRIFECVGTFWFCSSGVECKDEIYASYQLLSVKSETVCSSPAKAEAAQSPANVVAVDLGDAVIGGELEATTADAVVPCGPTSPRKKSVTAKLFLDETITTPVPLTATSKIFAPRTEEMSKGFLTFSEEEPGLTSKYARILQTKQH